MARKPEDDSPGVPFPMSPVSNGEWCPLPVKPKQRLAARLIAEESERLARRHGMTRAQFLRTAAGTATAFWVLNKVHGLDQWGDAAAMPVKRDHCEDLAAGSALLDHDMFVMDVQAHHVDLRLPTAGTGCFLRFTRSIERFAQLGYKVSQSTLTCPEVIGQANFVKELFVDSQTTIGVLSGLPYSGVLIGPRAMAETRTLVNNLAHSQRALSQAMIEPQLPMGSGQTSLDTFEQQVNEFGGAALKCYTYSGNWRIDDEKIAYPMLAEAKRLGIGLVNIHKGLPAIFAPGSPESVRAIDFPKAVADHPDLKFCAYHSAYFQEGTHPEGKDGLTEWLEVIASIPKKLRRNVYSELGSTFAITLLEGPDQAAHLVGSLLKALGSRNILWGTDSVWWGSPQFLIDAFKNLQIPAAMQRQFGYPPLTENAKRRILGGNAARLYRIKRDARRCTVPADGLAAMQQEQGGFRPDRTLLAHGPRTRREFLALLMQDPRRT